MAKKKRDLSNIKRAEGAAREEALQKALKQIEKDFGTGSLMKLGERNNRQIDVISSGTLSLDIALGVGGFPRGRIVEIFGSESSGKTTITLQAVAQVQKQGGIAAFIDAEHALDPAYAEKLGVNINELYLSQPDSGEQGLTIAQTLIESGAIDLIVIDSVAALVPQTEIDGTIEDQQVGLQARMMSKGLRRISSSINKTKTVVIFINQLRDNIGGFGPAAPSSTTPGGRALKFYATQRIEVGKGTQIKQGDEKLGNEMKITVKKNKVAPPFKIATPDMIFGEGVSPYGEILKLGEEVGFVKKSGSWYSIDEVRIGQGGEKARQWLRDNPEKYEEYRLRIREYFELPTEIKLDADKEKVEKPKRKKAAKKEEPTAPAPSDEIEIDDSDLEEIELEIDVE
ncbi:MAG: recombinase RecA [Streptococcaceae bacterium]|nr:recombinase RecA [Streptococcaceae bacterium]